MSELLRRALRFPLQEEANPDGEGGGGGEGKGEKKGGEGEPTMEERAARMGWVPKDKFRGDPEKWTDAQTFVKNGEESLPILRERLRKAEQTAADALKTAGEMKKLSDESFKKGYDKRTRELEAEIKAKAKAGDDAGAAAAATELADLKEEKGRREAAPEKDPVFDAWELQNDWYKDAELREEAEVEAFRLRKKGSKLEGEDFLNAVKEAVKKKHPEKFGNPRRSQPGATERSAGGGEGGDRGGKKGWEQLPAAAKEAGERYIKQKLYKDKAAYAEAYFAQE